MPVNHANNGGTHKHVDRGLDFYETPEGATRALVENLPDKVWEPCAGKGAILRVLRDAGRAVVASDIKDYGFPLHFTGDFFTQSKIPAGCEAIVTNFPFRRIAQFVEHALELSPLVIALARLSFLASEERADILKRLVRFHAFENRLPMMHRGSWTGNRSSSSAEHAWFILDRNHRGGPWRGDRVKYEYLPGEREEIRTANRIANRNAKSSSRGRDHRAKNRRTSDQAAG